MCDKKITFLFRCVECKLILSAEFEEPEDLEDVRNDKLYLECLCGDKCWLLRD